MRILILCGIGTKWHNYLGVPKQLAPIMGQPLLERTLQQLHDLGHKDIHIISNDSRLHLAHANAFMPGQQGLSHHSHRILTIAIAPKDRVVLHDRIAKRFDAMLKVGFIEEVTQLKQNPALHADLPAMRAVGYRQVWQYLNGEYDYATMRDKAIAATRQLAKRQLTWLRSWPNVHWFHPEEENCVTTIKACITTFLQDSSCVS